MHSLQGVPTLFDMPRSATPCQVANALAAGNLPKLQTKPLPWRARLVSGEH